MKTIKNHVTYISILFGIYVAYDNEHNRDGILTSNYMICNLYCKINNWNNCNWSESELTYF